MTRAVHLMYFFMHNFLADMKNNDLSEDHVAGSLEANNRTEDHLQGIR